MGIRRWRKMTWVLWIWTAIFVVWIIAGIADRASEDCAPGDELCIDASDVGTGIGVALIFFLWFIGFLVLGLIWLMSKPRHRQCPRCGHDVKKGWTKCRNCGYDYTLAGQAEPPTGEAGGQAQPVALEATAEPQGASTAVKVLLWIVLALGLLLAIVWNLIIGLLLVLPAGIGLFVMRSRRRTRPA